MEQIILIVEDDEASYLYLESILKKTSASVIRAVNAAGCDDYLAKPLKKELLFSKLELFGIKL